MNYKETFCTENKSLLHQYAAAVARFNKKIEIKQGLIVIISFLFFLVGTFLTLYFLAGWKFLGFGIETVFDDFRTGNVHWGFTILITLVSSGLIALLARGLCVRLDDIVVDRYKESTPSEIDDLNKKLEEKATDFVMRTYLQDVFAVLSTLFTLSNEFKEKFRDHFENNYLFDTDNAELSIAKFSFNHLVEDDNEPFIIHHEVYKHYLKTWDYKENQPFRFFLERIHPDGRVENLEYELPCK